MKQRYEGVEALAIGALIVGGILVLSSVAVFGLGLRSPFQINVFLGAVFLLYVVLHHLYLGRAGRR